MPADGSTVVSGKARTILTQILDKEDSYEDLENDWEMTHEELLESEERVDEAEGSVREAQADVLRAQKEFTKAEKKMDDAREELKDLAISLIREIQVIQSSLRPASKVVLTPVKAKPLVVKVQDDMDSLESREA